MRNFGFLIPAVAWGVFIGATVSSPARVPIAGIGGFFIGFAWKPVYDYFAK